MRVSIALTAWYRRASVAGSTKDGNPPLFSHAASLRSPLREVASDAQVLQAGENDGIKAAGLGSWVQRQELLSSEKCRGLGGAVTQTAVTFQTKEMLTRRRWSTERRCMLCGAGRSMVRCPVPVRHTAATHSCSKHSVKWRTGQE